MVNASQKTIQEEVSVQGIGLHTGRKCRITFKPAPANAGITFIRTDIPGQHPIKAIVENVQDVVRGTTIGAGDTRVYTIEHTLSALFGLGIDNCVIELDDNEPPVGDGSSKLFVEALRNAGIKDLNLPKKYFSVIQPVEYSSNQSLIRLEPGEGFQIDIEVNYTHPIIKDQRITFKDGDDYAALVSPARTYCFDFEIEALKKQGLAKGGSLDNAIVVGHSGIYNDNGGLRFKDEFVRHKLLDLMGDLMLLGQFLKGKLIAKRCGHGHNIKFLKLLRAQAESIPATPQTF